MSTPRLAFYVPVFPQYSETFIFNKFKNLLKTHKNIALICDYSPNQNWDLYKNDSKTRHIKRNTSKGFLQKPKFLASILGCGVLLLLFARRPLIVYHAIILLKKEYSFFSILKRIYQDFWFLWLKPQTIHFEFGNHFLDRIYLKKLWNPTIICSFRGYDLNYLGLAEKQYYQPVWNFCDYFHFLGIDLYNRALTRGFPQSKPYVLIPPSINPDIFKPSQNKTTPHNFDIKNPLKIITVSRLDWKKGYEWALAGLPTLMSNNIHFQYTIIGDGPMYEALSFAIHTLNLKNVVSLNGNFPPHQIPSILNDHHIYLQPSVSEGFCNAVLEAQAMELPVIATDADGLPENIEDGKTGFIVKRRDSEAMAEKIRWFYEHPEAIPVFGKRGRERVLEHFTLEQQAEKFEVWYKDILKDPN